MTACTRLPLYRQPMHRYERARTSIQQIRTVERESIWAELTVLAAPTGGGVTHLLAGWLQFNCVWISSECDWEMVSGRVINPGFGGSVRSSAVAGLHRVRCIGLRARP